MAVESASSARAVAAKGSARSARQVLRAIINTSMPRRGLRGRSKNFSIPGRFKAPLGLDMAAVFFRRKRNNLVLSMH
jgi:hypothetical protein